MANAEVEGRNGADSNEIVKLAAAYTPKTTADR